MSLRQVLGVLAVLLIASTVVRSLPSSDDVRNRPFERRVGVGQDVTTRVATYQVAGVDGARSMVIRDFGARTVTSPAILLAITIWHAGTESPSTLATPQLRDARDRTYGGIQWWSTCSRGQPVLGQTCQLVFEVSPEWLAGAELRIPTEWGVDGDHDEVAVIALGITSEQVTEWLQPRTVVKLSPSRPGRP